MDFLRDEILPLTPLEESLPEGELRTWVKNIGDILGSLRNDTYDEFEERNTDKIISLDVTSNLTIIDDDTYGELNVTTSTSTITVTLPDLVKNIGRRIRIRKVDSGSGKVTVAAAGSSIIRGLNAAGVSSVDISTRYVWWEFIACSDAWYEIDGVPATPYTPPTYLSYLKESDNANYTITDTDGYSIIVFKNLTADRTCYLPTLADNKGRKILIINTTGTYKVIVSPEGTEKINDYNAVVNITEKWGWWEFIASAGQWNGITDGNGTILEVLSETADTGLTLDGSWDDVTGMSLTLTPGKWLVSARAMQRFYDSSNPSYIFGYFGLGTTSGNNAPNIPRMFENYNGIAQLVNQAYGVNLNRKLVDESYSVSTNTTIYMKMAIESDEMSCTTHQALGATNSPMYIKARRIA